METNQHPSDYELVAKLRKGDLDAFDQIFKKYGDRLFGFALSYLKSKEETEGLVQDVFLKIWENRKNLKKESSFKSYLFTIAYHNMCEIFRKKQIHEKFLKEKSTTINASLNLEEQLEYKATLEQVNQLIDKLPEKQRIIFRISPFGWKSEDKVRRIDPWHAAEVVKDIDGKWYLTLSSAHAPHKDFQIAPMFWNDGIDGNIE